MRARKGSALDVLGIGQCSLDYVCTVDGMPPLGGKVAMDAYDVLPGGQVATAMLAAARLGLRAGYVGSVGSDAAADAALAPLAAAGVEIDGVHRVEGARTRLAVILVDRASGERTVLGHRDRRLRLGPEDVPAQRIERARCLLVDAEDPALSLAAAQVARRAGVPVVADVDAGGEGIDDLLGCVDFPLVSRSFAETLGWDGKVRSGLRRLVDKGARLAVATLGDRGSLAVDAEREIACPAFSITARDTTGAGDVFHAAFVWGLLEGLDGEELLRHANAAAAFSCRGVGAQGALASRKDLAAFLATHRQGPWRDPDSN